MVRVDLAHVVCEQDGTEQPVVRMTCSVMGKALPGRDEYHVRINLAGYPDDIVGYVPSKTVIVDAASLADARPVQGALKGRLVKETPKHLIVHCQGEFLNNGNLLYVSRELMKENSAR